MIGTTAWHPGRGLRGEQARPRPGRIINLTGTHEPIGLNAANSGTPVASATIANKEFFNDGDGERRQVTTFLDVTVWGPIRRRLGLSFITSLPSIAFMLRQK
jgi:Single-strand binding protein family